MSLFRSLTDDIILGTVDPPLGPLSQKVPLTPQEQDYHAAVWGITGSGKSKLLQGIYLQHLSQGHGVGLLEPHHDLSFDVLTYLVGTGFFRKEEAYDRLVYLDWGNGSYVPFNILAGTGEPHTIALNALEAMLRVWPELAEAPLFQTLFLSALMVLIANHLPITFLYQVLTDRKFRDQCLARVEDPLVHQTFDSYDQLGRDQVQAAGSTLRRAFLLSFNPVARYSLGQPDNLLDFRALMDAGKSVIINLGNIGDHETRQLLGAMLLVQIEQAALSRTDLAPAERRPFTLLIDEWPAFAAQAGSLSTILSQTRKFKLRLYLAAQSLSQISSERLTGALENCRVTIAFGLGRDSAEIQARHIGKADPFLVKEAAATYEQHTQYMSVPEQFESWTQELQNLDSRIAYVKLTNRPTIRMKTLAVAQPPVNPAELEAVLATYRRRYQRTLEEAERAISSIDVLGQSNSATPNGEVPPAYARIFQQWQTPPDASPDKQ